MTVEQLLTILGIILFITVFRSFWYHPSMFGNTWFTLSGLTEKKWSPHRISKYEYSLLLSCIIEAVIIVSLSIFILYFGLHNGTLQEKLLYIFCIGSFVSVFNINSIFEATVWLIEPWKLFCINAGFKILRNFLVLTLLVFLL